MTAGVTYLLDTNAISDLMRAHPRIENCMAGLAPVDRLFTVRDRKTSSGGRRDEMEETGHRFLAAFRCEPVPERAGGFYASVKLARQRSGLSLDENDLWIAARARHGIYAGEPMRRFPTD
jgi:predicted nucleic acid-binding protein